MASLLRLCRRTPAAAAAPGHGGETGFWMGTAFTVNYIMGCGFLGIPSGFVNAGLILGPLVVILFCLVMNASKDYMCEVIGRAEALTKVEAIAARSIELSRRRSDSLEQEVPRDAEVAGGAKQRASSLSRDLLETSVPAQGDVIHPTAKDYIIHVDRKFEVTDLFNTFVSRSARTVYVVILSMYMYGTLWAYASVFGASFAAHIPSFNGVTCDITHDSSDECRAAYQFWVGIFALIAVPVSTLELTEQAALQIVMFVARIVVVALLTGTILASFGCNGVAFASFAPGQWGGAPLFNLSGLAVLIPISVYAFIFHHSVPILAQPLKDKKNIRSVFMMAFVITGVAYVAIGFLVALFFGESVDAQCNLNWKDYVGCMATPSSWGSESEVGGTFSFAAATARVLHATRYNTAASGGSNALAPAPLLAPSCNTTATWDDTCVDTSNRPAYASLISFVVLIFPALDVLSAFPLNAMTLGNNLMSACLGEHALPPPPEAPANTTVVGAAAAGSAESEETAPLFAPTAATPPRPWYLATAHRHKMTKITFKLLSAFPPALGALFANNLGNILQFTGTIGVAIGFMIPAILVLYSFAKERAVFLYLTKVLRSQRHPPTTKSTTSTTTVLSREEEVQLASWAPLEAGGDRGSINSGATHATGSGSGGTTRHPQLDTEAHRVQGEVTIGEAAAKALRAAPSLREVLSHTRLDAIFRTTPYTTGFISEHRLPEILFVVSVGIAIFILAQVIADTVK